MLRLKMCIRDRIIDYRFMGKFKVVIEAEESLLQVFLPKMLVQPLVENAVLHGLEPKMDRGEVNVRFAEEQEENMCITVRDDGCGMESEELEKLRIQIKSYDEAVSYTHLDVYKRQMITFVFPMTGKTEGSSRTIALILVEESDLTRLVDIYSGKYEDNVLIFDYDNNLVTSSNKSTEFSEAEMEELLLWDGEEDARTIETSDGNFILSKVKSKTCLLYTSRCV